MTMVETSNVGVKVGMVGRGVKDAVDVAEGMDVCAAVDVGVEVELIETESGVG